MVNDTFGHEAGDTVLVEVYKCVRAELRQIDMLARWIAR
ncbi:MAG: diguanylate cyclase [Marinobacter sp.]|nr:diguanylate cyclase [Marinobacter sp.]MDX5334546.1 diguanylate cyclase [Marinobacter sp.]MDX5470747.1 diguanylate cyclase [Marinobacter sp.]